MKLFKFGAKPTKSEVTMPMQNQKMNFDWDDLDAVSVPAGTSKSVAANGIAKALQKLDEPT
ncbi:hypothetical protein [Shimia sp. R9_3]|uniref:hypothetical protein n=1 Tax=Shimia sp. R9_3 TaxID=2821113 RepID=UPI001ADB52F1|nr:hypothetical protein [Shimia sp. R9_3]MBO9401427.1 hypothetical protein [Shimia sp. R9_3]